MVLRRHADAFSVCLHTDQQSLILGEMMTARNKLSEENQMLRDKLQDAEMLIQMLQLKLKDQCDSSEQRPERENNAKRAASKSNRKLALQTRKEPDAHANASRVTPNPPPLSIRVPQKSTGMLLLGGKHAFRNQGAPGKKTFSTSTIDTCGTSSSNTGGGTSTTGGLGGRCDLVQGKSSVSSSPDSHRAEPSEPSRTVSRTNTRRGNMAMSKPKTNAVKATGTSAATIVTPPPRPVVPTTPPFTRVVPKKPHSLGGRSGSESTPATTTVRLPVVPPPSLFGEEQFPGDARQRRSVIGKLAQVVINEYSNHDDSDLIFI